MAETYELKRRTFLKLGAAGAFYLLTGCNPFKNNVEMEEFLALERSISTLGYNTDAEFTKYSKGDRLKLYLPDIHVPVYIKKQRKRVENIDATVKPDVIGLEGLEGEIDNKLLKDAKQEYRRYINNWFKTLPASLTILDNLKLLDMNIFMNLDLRMKYFDSYPWFGSPGLQYFDMKTNAPKFGMENIDEYKTGTEIAANIQTRYELEIITIQHEILEDLKKKAKTPFEIRISNDAYEFLDAYIPRLKSFIDVLEKRQTEDIQKKLRETDPILFFKGEVPRWFMDVVEKKRSKSWVRNLDSRIALMIGGYAHRKSIYDAVNHSNPIISLDKLTIEGLIIPDIKSSGLPIMGKDVHTWYA